MVKTKPREIYTHPGLLQVIPLAAKNNHKGCADGLFCTEEVIAFCCKIVFCYDCKQVNSANKQCWMKLVFKDVTLFTVLANCVEF